MLQKQLFAVNRFEKLFPIFQLLMLSGRSHNFELTIHATKFSANVRSLWPIFPSPPAYCSPTWMIHKPLGWLFPLLFLMRANYFPCYLPPLSFHI